MRQRGYPRTGSRAWRSSSSWPAARPGRGHVQQGVHQGGEGDAQDRHVGNQLQNGLRREGARRHRRRGARDRRTTHGATIELAIDPTGRPHPGQRHRPSAAQDAVRRTLRLPGGPGQPEAQPRQAGEAVNGQDRARTPSRSEGPRRLLPCSRPCNPRTSRSRSAPWPTPCADAATSWAPTWPAPAPTSEQYNTVLPTLQRDISHLADFSDTYQSAASRPPRRPGQPVDHQPHGGRPEGAAPPHLHRRGRSSSNADGGLPEDQRAEPDLAGPDVPARCSGCSRSTRRSTPACSTG